jgi:hypothetical protein
MFVVVVVVVAKRVPGFIDKGEPWPPDVTVYNIAP